MAQNDRERDRHGVEPTHFGMSPRLAAELTMLNLFVELLLVLLMEDPHD